MASGGIATELDTRFSCQDDCTEPPSCEDDDDWKVARITLNGPMENPDSGRDPGFKMDTVAKVFLDDDEKINAMIEWFINTHEDTIWMLPEFIERAIFPNTSDPVHIDQDLKLRVLEPHDGPENGGMWVEQSMDTSRGLNNNLTLRVWPISDDGESSSIGGDVPQQLDRWQFLRTELSIVSEDVFVKSDISLDMRSASQTICDDGERTVTITWWFGNGDVPTNQVAMTSFLLSISNEHTNIERVLNSHSRYGFEDIVRGNSISQNICVPAGSYSIRRPCVTNSDHGFDMYDDMQNDGAFRRAAAENLHWQVGVEGMSGHIAGNGSSYWIHDDQCQTEPPVGTLQVIALPRNLTSKEFPIPAGEDIYRIEESETLREETIISLGISYDMPSDDGAMFSVRMDDKRTEYDEFERTGHGLLAGANGVVDMTAKTMDVDGLMIKRDCPPGHVPVTVKFVRNLQDECTDKDFGAVDGNGRNCEEYRRWLQNGGSDGGDGGDGGYMGGGGGYDTAGGYDIKE